MADQPSISGEQNNKNFLGSMIGKYQGKCVPSASLSGILNMCSQYSNSVNANKGAYQDFLLASFELVKLMRSFFSALEGEEKWYVSDFKKRFGTADVNRLSNDDRVEYNKCVKRIQLFENTRKLMAELLNYFYACFVGTLKDEKMPKEPALSKSSFNTESLPVMLHSPLPTDFSEQMLDGRPLFAALKELAASCPEEIMNMFHDYNNGDVCVRLFRDVDGEQVPHFVSLEKYVTFLNCEIYEEHASIWPDFIQRALDYLHVDTENMEVEELLKTITGKEN